MVEAALARGVILRPLQDVVSFCPPLIVTEVEIDLLFDTVAAALDEVGAALAAETRSAVA